MSSNCTILIAEDEEDEAFLLKRALKKAAISNSIHCVGNGEEVIAYLSGAKQFADRGQYPLPTVILLDLNMPKMNGFEVIAWVRQSAYKTLAIDVFSGSTRNEDILRALSLGANLYLKKPVTVGDLEGLLNGYRQVIAWRGFSRP